MAWGQAWTHHDGFQMQTPMLLAFLVFYTVFLVDYTCFQRLVES